MIVISEQRNTYWFLCLLEVQNITLFTVVLFCLMLYQYFQEH